MSPGDELYEKFKSFVSVVSPDSRLGHGISDLLLSEYKFDMHKSYFIRAALFKSNHPVASFKVRLNTYQPASMPSAKKLDEYNSVMDLIQCKSREEFSAKLAQMRHDENDEKAQDAQGVHGYLQPIYNDSWESEIGSHW